MRRIIVIMLLLLATATAAQAKTQRPSWLPPLWYGIAMCEEQMDWSVHGPTYESAFGMWYGTWDEYRPSNYPPNGGAATPWEQYQVALNVAFRGITKNGVYIKPAGLTAWGSYRNGCYRSYT